MKSYYLLGPNLEIDLEKIQNSFLSSGRDLKIYGDTKNTIDCTNLDFPTYSQITIDAHGSIHNTINLCKETSDTNNALPLIAKNKPQNFELFSCYSGMAIDQRLVLPKFTTLITSTSDNNLVLSEFNSYSISSLSKVKNNNPFIKFVHYIYLTPDVVKFAIQTHSGNLIYQTNFYELVNYSNDQINEWREAKLIEFIDWIKNSKEYINDSIRLEEINEFIESFAERKKSAEQLSKKYSVENYKSFLLFHAAYNNILKVIDNLLDSDIELNFQLYGASALHMATQNGHAEVVQKLIDAKADLNLQLNGGFTALYIAAQYGHAEVVQKLIDAKADLNLQLNGGFTALYVAAQYGHAEVVQKLIDAKANLNIKFKNIFTVLDIAASYKYLNVVKTILASGYSDISGKLDLSSSKEIKEEVNKFNSNPIKYILEANNITERAENALSIFLERTKDNFASKVFYNLEPYLPHAFSYLEPAKSLINEIHETRNCLAAQEHTTELDLYSLCGGNSSWYHTEL